MLCGPTRSGVSNTVTISREGHSLRFVHQISHCYRRKLDWMSFALCRSRLRLPREKLCAIALSRGPPQTSSASAPSSA